MLPPPPFFKMPEQAVVPPRKVGKVPERGATLPNKLTNQSIAKFAKDDEKYGILLEYGAPNHGLWTFRCRGSRILIFAFDQSRSKHVFICPVSVWEANGGKLAKEVYESPLLNKGGVTIVPHVVEWDMEVALKKTVPRKFGNPAPVVAGSLPSDLELVPIATQIAEEIDSLPEIEVPVLGD